MAWDKIFGKKAEITEPDSFVKEFYEKYESELKKGPKMLDLGCGTGRHAIFFAENGFEVYAQDKSKLALNILKESLKGKTLKITTILQEIDEVPYHDGFFDIVISTIVLHHGTEAKRRKWLEEITRVLKPNGFLAISVLSTNDRRHGTGKEVEPNTRVGISDTFDAEIPHHFFEKEELVEFLKDFHILEMGENEHHVAEGYGKFRHWNVVARLER